MRAMAKRTTPAAGPSSDHLNPPRLLRLIEAFAKIRQTATSELAVQAVEKLAELSNVPRKPARR